jgi:regulator of replication initiation timing
VHGQKQNLFDSLVAAKMELKQLKADTASTGKEIRYLKATITMYQTTDSLRTEMVILRARLAMEEIKNYELTTRMSELKEDNKKLKRKLFLEAGAAVVLGVGVYLLVK